MTSASGRRLAKLEGALPPKEAVLAWLVEAQQFQSLEDHARSIVELPVEAAPLSVIARRVETATREGMKGQPRAATEAAVHRAVRNAVFLFCLVFKVNEQALEIAKVEGLRATAVFFWMSALLGGPRAEDLEAAEARVYRDELAGKWTLWRSVVDRLEVDLRVEIEARATIEEKFFGGHDVLLADAATEWAGHVDLIERLSGLADAMHVPKTANARRRPPIGMEPAASVKTSGAARAETLGDDARVRAYEVLGDRPRAVEIMERRLSVQWAARGGEVQI
jgi:hypothetical protein